LRQESGDQGAFCDKDDEEEIMLAVLGGGTDCTALTKPRTRPHAEVPLLTSFGFPIERNALPCSNSKKNSAATKLAADSHEHILTFINSWTRFVQ